MSPKTIIKGWMCSPRWFKNWICSSISCTVWPMKIKEFWESVHIYVLYLYYKKIRTEEVYSIVILKIGLIFLCTTITSIYMVQKLYYTPTFLYSPKLNWTTTFGIPQISHSSLVLSALDFTNINQILQNLICKLFW